MFNRRIGIAFKVVKLCIAAVAVVVTGSAQALALLGQEPAPSFIVDAGGFEWVYAAPCAGEDPSCGIVQLHHGFSFATDAEWNASFADVSALVAAFTLPGGSTNCASTYFSTAHNHCDMSDTVQGYIWHSPLALNASYRDASWAETFLIRASNNTVPEPGSLALLGLGLAGLGFTRRRKAN